ncbi:hypothetical protein HU200_034565 [Digitaria exilis]|uniref:F-box domain-containing protein n=1 Tax=Digitaria exilis TaxID=1010633 RepID=A0A835EQE4_9POAL|nr:hypothetical protein HU200_034565 [Digitaria exilis]
MQVAVEPPAAIGVPGAPGWRLGVRKRPIKRTVGYGPPVGRPSTEGFGPLEARRRRRRRDSVYAPPSSPFPAPPFSRPRLLSPEPLTPRRSVSEAPSPGHSFLSLSLDWTLPMKCSGQTMEPPEAKRKKARQRRGGAEPDRLSALPDCLLHTIMSSLKARQAVQTCVLSTRWRHLWRSVPCLDIDLDEFKAAPNTNGNAGLLGDHSDSSYESSEEEEDDDHHGVAFKNKE